LQITDARTRSGRRITAKTWRTDPGRQDHTTSPSADGFAGSSGACVCSPRTPTQPLWPRRVVPRRVRTHGFPPCLTQIAPALPRPPQARPASR